jgi:hypothetical protein
MAEDIRAEYIRFEIYIPVQYEITLTNEQTGDTRSITRALDMDEVKRFIAATGKRYQGITQANPIAPSPYKGWWQASPRAPISIDRLTYLFGLVRLGREEDAIRHFTRWKRKFEESLDQDVILVTYYPVRIIGNFLSQ